MPVRLEKLKRTLGVRRVPDPLPGRWQLAREVVASESLRSTDRGGGLLRIAIVGRLADARPWLLREAEADTLPAAERAAFTWLATASFDDEAVRTLAVMEAEREDYLNSLDWFLFLRNDDASAARLAVLKKKAAREKRTGSGGDGNTADETHRLCSIVDLLAWVGSPDASSEEREAAFAHYFSERGDYYDAEDLVFASLLRARLASPQISPEDAMRHLHGFLRDLNP